MNYHFLLNEYNIPKPIIELVTQDFDNPTEIQLKSIPFTLTYNDLIGISPNGSGKTLAFTIPSLLTAFTHLNNKINNSPSVLILSPTRELTIQTYNIIKKYCDNLNIKSCCIYGEGNENEEKNKLNDNIEIIVATPGKLIKYIKEKVIFLSNISLLVLDEADKLIDLSFQESFNLIFEQLSKKHQTLLFSATWPTYVHNFSKKYITDNTQKIIIADNNTNQKIPSSITQKIEIIERKNQKREKRLIELLNQYQQNNNNLILIFVLYKSEASKLCDFILNNSNYKCGYIEGDMKQKNRTIAIENFKNGMTHILIATDVISRGIDIDNISHVINFSMGLSIENYIHRIGRCGRNNNIGIAHTFFVDYDYKFASDLIQILYNCNQNIPKELYDISKEYTNTKNKFEGDSYFHKKYNKDKDSNNNSDNNSDSNSDNNSDINSEDREFFGDSCKIIKQKSKNTHTIHNKNNKNNNNNNKNNNNNNNNNNHKNKKN